MVLLYSSSCTKAKEEKSAFLDSNCTDVTILAELSHAYGQNECKKRKNWNTSHILQKSLYVSNLNFVGGIQNMNRSFDSLSHLHLNAVLLNLKQKPPGHLTKCCIQIIYLHSIENAFMEALTTAMLTT